MKDRAQAAMFVKPRCESRGVYQAVSDVIHCHVA